MNSSGIKRGLAGSAVAALAVTGLPFLASSAHAAVGDSITVASVGPTLNGGSVGGVVVLKTKGISQVEAEGTPESGANAAVPSQLKLANAALTGSPNSSSQTVSIVGTPTFVADKSTNDSNKTDGLDEVIVHVAVTTAAAGDTAQYAVYLDDDQTGTNKDTVQASEPRAQVSQTTSGQVSKVEVAPASQSVVQGQKTGDYTVTIKDDAGRVTQLASGEVVGVAGTGVATSVDSLDAAALERGTATFTADATDSSVGAHDITLDGPGNADAKAVANVTKAAGISADEVDVVTAADSWDGFGGGSTGGTTAVRVDQSSIRIDFKSKNADDDKNSTVTLTVNGTGVTFGGKPSTTATTLLNGNGVGSVVIIPDAGTVQEGDSIAVSGNGFSQTFRFERAEVQALQPTAGVYFSKLDGAVDVTAKVVDQFGLPVTAGFVEAQRTGANADTTPQRKAVGNGGTVTFTFTDKDATDGSTEDVALAYFPDQYASEATQSGTAKIKYTVDGMGSNFKTSLESQGDTWDTEAAGYKASDVHIVPLADAEANDRPYTDTWYYWDNDDASRLSVANGEPGAAITVSVDNGALILQNGEYDLSEGSSSITDTVDSFGNLPSGYRIVGTKSGLVTVTISSAHRTETAQMTVSPDSWVQNARNVSVSGPAEVGHGTTQIPFTAVVTDAFGNPVSGVPADLLNVQVTGPGQFQDGDVETNDAGQLQLNVRVDADASGPVSIKVTGLPEDSDFDWWTQFGAKADRHDKWSESDDAKGLPASANVATATTTVQEPVVVEPESINLVAKGKNTGKKADVLKVRADDNAAGLVANVFVKGEQVASHALDESGDWNFTIKDMNGKKATKYTVEVAGSELTLPGTASKKIK